MKKLLMDFRLNIQTIKSSIKLNVRNYYWILNKSGMQFFIWENLFWSLKVQRFQPFCAHVPPADINKSWFTHIVFKMRI